ncbi:hypothetical protein LCGC14_1212830 [marine sediment metagenome]|uniref:Uncharacterized protein n=1 Tax=marine sediment metagenome TaxID=412755 RepID=A0A0F9PI64_9ZZZZ
MKLDLVWSAHFEDSTCIAQYDDAEQVKEHLFREVQDKQKESRLSTFSLSNCKTGTNYQVDLLGGRILIRPSKCLVRSYSQPELEVQGSAKYEYRLIYFRRVTHEMKWDGKKISEQGQKDIQYFLGFQYTNEKNENVKRLLQISKNDEVYFA